MSDFRMQRPASNRPGRQSPARSHHPKRHLDKCPVSGKVRFRDKREAQDALHRAVAQRQLLGAEGHACRRQEKRTYNCPSCKGWHLTSRDSTPIEWIGQTA